MKYKIGSYVRVVLADSIAGWAMPYYGKIYKITGYSDNDYLLNITGTFIWAEEWLIPVKRRKDKLKRILS